MHQPAPQFPHVDVCLLLRAHAEARWLSREVVPLIRELEYSGGSRAGLASYLVTLWVEARHHAAETDALRIELDALPPGVEHDLYYNARRYHAVVRRLRAAIDRRVQPLVGALPDARASAGKLVPRTPEQASAQPASGPAGGSRVPAREPAL
jgi:hypothetical protein